MSIASNAFESSLTMPLPEEYENRRITRSIGRALATGGASSSVTGSTCSVATSTSTVARPNRLALARLPASHPWPRHPIHPMIKGFVYSADTSVPRSAMFKVKTGVTFDFGGRMIPDIHVARTFRIPADATVYHSFVTYNGRTFLVYGFNLPSFPLNAVIMALKKTTEWRGDVIVFCLGLAKALLQAPTTKKAIIDTVACIFVSRVTEYRDLGLAAPFMIEA